MKIAVILSRVPYPLEKGDKLRAFHQIKNLSENNEIHLYALSTEKIHADAREVLSEFCKEIHFYKIRKFNIFRNLIWAFFMGLPFQVGYFHHFKWRRKISKSINRLQPDHVYNQLLRTAEYSKFLDIPKTIDYQDVFSKGLARRANNAGFIKKALIRIEYRRVLRYESRIYDWFQHHTIISDTDRKLLPIENKNNIQIISNGVDLEYFKAESCTKEYDLIFTGNMAYHPNVTAALFLIENIFPLILKKLPSARLVIAGASPVMAIKQHQSKNIHVTGWVDDLRTYYNKSQVFVAPMLTGTGLQNKLLEAMAMNLPCVTSHLANRPLGGFHGKELLLANNAQEYAQLIIKLLDDAELRESIIEKASVLVNSNFSWSESTKKLEKLFASTI